MRRVRVTRNSEKLPRINADERGSDIRLAVTNQRYFSRFQIRVFRVNPRRLVLK